MIIDQNKELARQKSLKRKRKRIERSSSKKNSPDGGRTLNESTDQNQILLI